MGDEKTDSYYVITDITVSEQKPSEGHRPRVILRLQTSGKKRGLDEVELVLDPDLAVRHGKALVEAEKAIQDEV